jgi:hypothetical protein
VENRIDRHFVQPGKLLRQPGGPLRQPGRPLRQPGRPLRQPGGPNTYYLSFAPASLKLVQE